MVKILYLEDNPIDADLAYRHFSRHASHLNMTIAATLAEARDLLTIGEPYDLALLDLRLPDGSGLDLLGEIRRRNLPTAVVILTGSGDDSIIVNILKAGADDYVIKGDHLDPLPGLLEKAIRRFREQGHRWSAPLKVLYLDNRPAEVEMIRRYFISKAPHIQLTVEEKPSSLLTRLSPEANVPLSCDVLLINATMPKIDVLGMLNTLREKVATDLPVVVIADQGSERMKLQALRAGAADCINNHPGYLDLLPKVLEIVHQRTCLIREQSALKASEERFRELFLNMQDGVAIYEAVDDGEDFILRLLNPSGAAMVRVDAATVINRRVTEVFPGIRDRGLLEVIRKVWQTGRPRRHPVTRYRDNRLQMWFENYVCRLSSGNIVAIYKDMTQRKKAEDNLRQSEQMLRTVIDASPNCVYVKNADGAYVLANKALCELYGLVPQELIGATDTQLAARSGIDPEGLQRLVTADASVSQQRQPVTIEKASIRCAEGSTRWFRVIKVPVSLIDAPHSVLSIAADITDQLAAEDQRSLLFTAIEQSPETVLITNREGLIQYANPSFEKITGYSRQEVLGQNPRLLKSGQHDPAFYQAMWSTLLRGDTWRGRIVNRKKEGALFTEEVSISPVHSRGGKVLNYVAVKRDISSELETESRLRQAQKMEAIGTLAGGIAHDFNNILTSAIGYTELALDESTEGTPLRDYLNEINIANMRARDLVSQILTFARRSEEACKPVVVSRIVREAIKLLRASVPTSIEIRSMLTSDARVLADPTQLHQVFMNLCTNAVHAMEDHGGTLDIRLEAADVPPMPTDSRPFRPWLKFSVTDTGCGIPAEHLDTIFEPYFTTKGIGEGTGLGLSVVHGIVTGCGGDIGVVSRPGAGTTFTVYLPIVGEQQGIEENAAGMVLAKGTEHILVVDDEAIITRMVGKTLEHQGYRATLRTSSVEALALFRHAPDRFDMVISDMTMPNMSGDHLATEILSVRPDLPFILCTGYSKKLDPEKVAAIGIRAFVMKPFDRGELLSTIRKVLDGKPLNPAITGGTGRGAS